MARVYLLARDFIFVLVLGYRSNDRTDHSRWDLGESVTLVYQFQIRINCVQVLGLLFKGDNLIPV